MYRSSYVSRPLKALVPQVNPERRGRYRLTSGGGGAASSGVKMEARAAAPGHKPHDCISKELQIPQKGSYHELL